jgi:hypothetical protein
VRRTAPISLGLLLLIFAWTPSSNARFVRLLVAKSDNPLVIRGKIGQEHAFIGNVRVTAIGGDPTFLFLPEDLRSTTGELIARANIKLIGAPMLARGEPTDLQIEVTGIQEPGRYRGRVALLIPGRSLSQATRIKLDVFADATPVVEPTESTKTLQLNLAQCQQRQCWLAHRLLPAGQFRSTWTLKLDNKTHQNVTVEQFDVSITGEDNGLQLDASQFGAPKTPLILKPSINPLPFSFKANTIPSGHYSGALTILVKGTDTRLVVPVDLKIRNGPWGALIAIVIGVLLGRLVKFMQGRGAKQLDALTSIRYAEEELHELKPEDRQIVQPMINDLRRRARLNDLEGLTDQVEAVKKRMIALGHISAIEDRLGDSNDPVAKEVRSLLTAARDSIKTKSDAEAAEMLKNAEKRLNDSVVKAANAGQPHTLIAQALAFAGLARVASSGASMATAIGDELETTAKKVFSVTVKVIRWIFARLSGFRPVAEEGALWILRGFISIALAVGLVVVGLTTLYAAQQGATFGSGQLTDYFGLIVWGLSADVAGRTLANLKGTTP